MSSETTILQCWHIIKNSKGFRVYSHGLRPYGTFKTMDKARDYIEHNFPNKRTLIVVQDEMGRIINQFTYRKTMVLKA